MNMRSNIFTFAEQGRLTTLVAMLIDARGQFTVSPFPQGLRSKQEGWIVSYPPDLAERVEMPDAEPAEAPTDPVAA